MSQYPFATVDVFTAQRFGGNPLAVFTDARGLTDAQMQSLAAEMNLSETTFVLPAEDPGHAARVRIFNRTAEMTFAGHPMVGTAYVLARLRETPDEILWLEVLAGNVKVKLERASDGAVIGARIAAPQTLTIGESVPVDVVARCVGLESHDVIVDTHQPSFGSVGVRHMIVEVAADALGRATPDLVAFRRGMQEHPTKDGRFSILIYAHADSTGAPPETQRIRARMFAPISGTVEDPATGSACSTLGALLLSHSKHERRAYEILQGVEMGRPSALDVRAWRADDGVHASVSGRCVDVLHGEATV